MQDNVIALLPPQCAPSISNAENSYIKNFTFEKIKNASSFNASGIADYTQSEVNTELYRGENYTGTVQIGGPAMKRAVGIWIDFNNDKNFGQDEYVFGDVKEDSLIELINIRIPNSEAVIGIRRMRIKVRELNAFNYSESCVSYLENGETEDYLIEIKARQELLGAEVLTPNNDGKNDCFIIRGINPRSTIRSLQVFDITGNMVFEDDFYENDWCGIADRLLPRGTYYYMFETDGTVLKSYFELIY